MMQRGATTYIIIVFFILMVGGSPQVFASGSVGSQPQLWVLSIGISNYEAPTFRLSYAHRDALVFLQELRRLNHSLPDSRVLKLINQSATKDNIYAALERLKRSVKQNDTVIIFFSGHGTVVYDPDYERKFLNGLLPYDADQLVSTNDIPYTEFTKRVAEIPSAETVVIIDACYSGGITNVLPVADPFEADNLNASKPNVTYLLSCEANQVSKESHTLKHGMFTYFLVQGLRGKADLPQRPGSGQIDVVELSTYVQYSMAQAGHPQKPILIRGSDQPVFFTGFERQSQPYQMAPSSSGLTPPQPKISDNGLWPRLYDLRDYPDETSSVEVGDLVVKTNPPGATVRVDGIIAGSSPLKYKLPPGEHGIHIFREGYEPEIITVRIEPGRVHDVYVNLQR
ncbi:MAG: PEGA domain-containing protein [Gemmatimonadetes bacterium]|nr:MAG: PEGA domain-containing protein [Gemmatimonadota bacterium]